MTPTVHLGAPAPADVDALVALEAAALPGEAWTRAQVADELTAPGRVLRVAREGDAGAQRAQGAQGGAVLGWLDLAVAGDVADLLRIAVAEGARRHGLASRLLGDGLAAVPPGVRRVLLEVASGNAAARAFYARHGFTEVDRRRGYYRDGDDAVVLQCVLPDPSPEA